MNKYVNLAKVNSNYAMRMNRLSNRIFGEVVRPTNQKSMKVVKLFAEKPVNKRSEVVNYYPRTKETETMMDHLRNYGLYRNEHKDFNEEYNRLRLLRGKSKWIPPPFRNKQETKT
ncbi:28S ribosomal protein S33, mitochondrial [Harpegnathos saltator]|uniref:Small ribosomal subunit protein mS33 n=1 Tax=Harpegnathos saltator TaxID=610380 RepID=E2B3W2_HARSA|nr:28S ribosomal protein S33, mitochondrial [Harpegnathos saltator]EFN89631.1 28S ribosomal protein S33, mitochondrial [Harpegnathos saltator]